MSNVSSKSSVLGLLVVLLLATSAGAQTVGSGYAKLAEGVYAFTVDGGDHGFIAGCELGNDVKVIVARGYADIEEYSVSEQLKLQNCEDTPSLVAVGFPAKGAPSVLLLGIAKDPEAWPTFHKLTLGDEKVILESYPTSLIAGMFDEPGAWAELCPFFAREETLQGFSALYYKSYVFARPDGSFAGLIWRDNGLWIAKFAEGKIVVDRIYAPKDGCKLAPVWHATCSRGGRLTAVIAEAAINPEVETVEPVEPETPAIEPSPDGSSDSGEAEEGENGDLGGEEPGTAPSFLARSCELSFAMQEGEGETPPPGEETEPPQDEGEGQGEESPPEIEETPPSEEETPPAEGETPLEVTEVIAGEVTPEEMEPEIEPAVVTLPGEGEVDLVMVYNFGEKTWSTPIGRFEQPLNVSCATAVDGRPFAYWILPGEDNIKLAYYWGLKHDAPDKVVPFELNASPKAAPPFAAMRAMGLPALMHEQGGKVLLRLNNGSSPDWVTQEAYALAGRLMGVNAVMGLKTTAWFILDDDKLMWHWHANK